MWIVLLDRAMGTSASMKITLYYEQLSWPADGRADSMFVLTDDKRVVEAQQRVSKDFLHSASVEEEGRI
jgi:hypothetical protein